MKLFYQGRYVTEEEYLKLSGQLKAEEDLLFEMVNVLQSYTGLPMVIFISPKGNAKHGPRIKVQVNYSQKANMKDAWTVTISDDPEVIDSKKQMPAKDLKLVKEFIIKNKEILLKHWNDSTDPVKTVQSLKSIENKKAKEKPKNPSK